MTTPPSKSWHARLRLGFAPQGAGRSVLHERTHEGPMRVLRPLYPDGPGICHVAVLHPPSGIAGGDQIDLHVDVAAGAHATLTTPGATRWYKANGNHSRQSMFLHVAAGACLDWLPLENLFFEEADATLETEVDLQPGARAIGWEISQLGAITTPGHWQRGHAHSRIALRSAGKLLWVEQGAITAAGSLRTRVTGLAGLPVYATLWCHGPKPARDATDALNALMPWSDTLRAGATLIDAGAGDALCLVRAIGLHSEEVRECLAKAWLHLRQHVFGVPATRPRLWNT